MVSESPIRTIAARRGDANDWDNQHNAYRGLALMETVTRLLNRKDARATVEGEEITYTYRIEATMQADGAVAVEMMDEDSGDFYKFTVTVG
jgi:hypothetical protein